MRIVFTIILFVTACAGPVSNNSKTMSHVNENAQSAAPASTIVDSTVTINSPDGVKLVGSLFPARKPNSPAILLLHQWESDRHSYDDFAMRMQRRGFTVLAIDGRGFGESTKKVDGMSVAAQRTDAAVKAMLGDIDAAVHFLMKQDNVDGLRVGIVGASYGSSLAILYAADHPFVAAVALLSPGLNYFGNMPTQPAIERYGDRVFMAASKEDSESAKAVAELAKEKPGCISLVVPTGSYHGADLFKYREATNGSPVVEDAVESFLVLALAEANPIRLGEAANK